MTLGSHQTTIGKSQVHITPKWIIDRTGPFDLDPCAADPRPWDCATHNYTEADNGLARPWHGRVYLNPPFDRYEVGEWISRLAQHGKGITLLHARTEATWFEPIWAHAACILFLADRIHFHRPDGTRHPQIPVHRPFSQHSAMKLRNDCIAAALPAHSSLTGRTNRQLCRDWSARDGQ